jgi:phospholipid-translocating ATPase
MANGVLGSILSFFIVIAIFGRQAFREDGQISGFEVFGTTMYTAIIWVVNCQIALTISYFTSIQHILIWGSIAMWYVFLLVFGFMSSTVSTTAYRVLLEALAPSPRYWIATFLVAVACVFPYFAYIAFQRRFRPMDHHILQEIKALNKDLYDPEMWRKEKRKAVEKATFGFTARVEARIKQLRERMHHHGHLTDGK